jgi:putative membrane protein
MSKATRHAALPVLFLLGAAACQSKSAGDRDRTATTTGAVPADSAGRTDSAKTPTATPKGGMTDSNIVALLDEANKADSAAGAVALKKATNANVKAFAKLMMSEHHALRVAGQDLAKTLGITPKPPERDPLAGYTRNEMDALQKTAKGPEFDQTYIDHEVSIHQAVLDFANQARVTTPTAELRDLIQKAVPVITKHLEQAQAIQKQLTPAA